MECPTFGNWTGSESERRDNNTVAADGYTLLEHYFELAGRAHALCRPTPPTLTFGLHARFHQRGDLMFANLTNCTVTLNEPRTSRICVPKTNFTGLASFDLPGAIRRSAMTNTMGLLVSITYIPKKSRLAR